LTEIAKKCRFELVIYSGVIRHCGHGINGKLFKIKAAIKRRVLIMRGCFSGKISLLIHGVLFFAIFQGFVYADSPSEQEKTYISSAGGYLKTQNEQGMKVTVVMNGLNTGHSNLDDVRDAIKRARSVTNAGWYGDYLRNGKLVVPSRFINIDKKIRESHKLREKAYVEWLKYWKDGDLGHIQQGHKIFERSEIVAQEATKDLTKIMKGMNKGK
jgi:hypothetical protein